MAVVGNIPIQENGYHEGNEDTLAHQVLTSQSYAGILAGMDNSVAFTLAIPLMVAHCVTMLSPSQCWCEHLASCEGGIPSAWYAAWRSLKGSRGHRVHKKGALSGAAYFQNFFVQCIARH